MHTACANADCIWTQLKLATLDPTVSSSYGARDELWALAVRGEIITALIPMSELDLTALTIPVRDMGGRWVTPGLIDCHTHLIFAGSRAAEWEMRLAGVPYSEIARCGGGIVNSMRATRAASEDELFALALPRARALAAEGVTCLEIKSGYGLTLDDEMKILRVARRVGESLPLEVSATLLAAHAVPPEFSGRSDAYIDHIINDMLPAAKGLAEAVDAFCEGIAFSAAQCERLFTAARAHGFAVKAHAEQLTLQHAAEVVARHGGWSADHLEFLDDCGVLAMQAAGTVGVMLPGAFYFLREKQKPPIAALRAAKVPMAVATDFNPGTSPFASLRLAMNQACVLFGLSPEEALRGATAHAARALGRGDRLGLLSVGKRADFLIWDVAHPAEIVYSLGTNPLVERVFRGKVTHV